MRNDDDTDDMPPSTDTALIYATHDFMGEDIWFSHVEWK